MALKRKTNVWKRKAKAERRSNKLWADGAREQVMRPHIEAYADALQRGWRAERDYLQKTRTSLSSHYRPTIPSPPAVEELTQEEKEARHARIEELNIRIRRWLKYRVRALRRGFSTQNDPRDNPCAVLLAKLAGVTNPPKARQAYQQYMRERYASDIAAVIAREMFGELSEEEQDDFRERAVAEARDAKEAYEKAMKQGPSKRPEDVRMLCRCIDELGRFMAPILEGVQSYTGLQSICVFGGPMPKYSGELGTTHVCVGTNLAPMPVGFAAWNKPRFARDVVEFMTEYLRMAYTATECAEAALPTTSLTDAKYSFTEPSDSESDDESDDSGDESGSGSDSAGEEQGGGKNAEGKDGKRKRKEKDDGEEARPSAKKTKTKKQVAVEAERAELDRLAGETDRLAREAEREAAEDLKRRQENERRWAENRARNAERLAALKIPKGSTVLGLGTSRQRQSRRRPGNGQSRRQALAQVDAAEWRNGSRHRDDGRSRRQRVERRPPRRRAWRQRPEGTTSTNTPVIPDAPVLDALTVSVETPDGTMTGGAVLPDAALVPDAPPVLPSAPATKTAGVRPKPRPAGKSNAPGTSNENGANEPAVNPPLTDTTPAATISSEPGNDAVIQSLPADSSAPPPLENNATHTGVKCPGDAPTWFQNVFGQISGEDVGALYEEVLDAFVKLEKSNEFRQAGGLPKAPRPAQVTDWIRDGRGRSVAVRPIDDLAKFEREWKGWWTALQPSWEESAEKRRRYQKGRIGGNLRARGRTAF
ncbi:hypothetical protein B0H13DRAFT_2380168 [Mycena leptocephala]|nr:hypothetical protein B0H13DRAFT_2380168 [Mycena leptocephala]